jgi:tRNA pseudouridine55 synthase
MVFGITRELLQEGKVMPFDKPYGWTSFYLVNKIRYYLCRHAGIKKLKVGHAGTLDPLATGLVILCTGKATKQISEIQNLPKEYIAEIMLGSSTPSFDLETKIDKTFKTEHITRELIEQKLMMFTGSIEQVPPLFSAKKINGIRAYKLAREGFKKELVPSQVEIHKIELLDYLEPLLILKISCSKGTYIRSLARDIGTELGSGAHLTALRRTAIGHYKDDTAINVENFISEIKLL